MILLSSLESHLLLLPLKLRELLPSEPQLLLPPSPLDRLHVFLQYLAQLPHLFPVPLKGKLKFRCLLRYLPGDLGPSDGERARLEQPVDVEDGFVENIIDHVCILQLPEGEPIAELNRSLRLSLLRVLLLERRGRHHLEDCLQGVWQVDASHLHQFQLHTGDVQLEGDVLRRF